MANLISTTEYAKMMGVTQRYIQQAIKAGYIVDGVQSAGRNLKIDPEVATREMLANGTGKHGKFHENAEKLFKLTAPERDDSDGVATDGMSLVEGKRLEQEYKAKLAQLKFEEESNRLVEKQKVYQLLFDFGKSVRDALLAVPDRCIDNILASTSRRAAHRILYDEVENALLELVKTKDKFENAFGEVEQND